MTPKRDPRTHPRPGDVLWESYAGTVTVHSLSPRKVYVRHLHPDGMTTIGEFFARQWRGYAAGMDVVTVADCPFWRDERAAR